MVKVEIRRMEVVFDTWIGCSGQPITMSCFLVSTPVIYRIHPITGNGVYKPQPLSNIMRR